MKSADVITVLISHGWKCVRTKGSHHQFRHPEQKGLVTVPHPKKQIWRQAGIKH
ncbi:type II toxin-antitoxin system HicA family toxin [Enterobacter mori]|uniref:type II toxin-antitoxin system HicA family toxin n=1 Tax=Enterobacter mori TaxID=539813 RepID=UPI000D35CEF8|nr:type II toxin-antitoxin system HicA family toxin [Enterobacter mori]